MGNAESQVSWVTVVDGAWSTNERLKDRFRTDHARALIDERVISYSEKKKTHLLQLLRSRFKTLYDRNLVPILIGRTSSLSIARSLARRWVTIEGIEAVIVVDPLETITFSMVGAFLDAKFLVSESLAELRRCDDDTQLTRIGSTANPESSLARLTAPPSAPSTPSRFGGARKRRRLTESPRGEVDALVHENRLHLVEKWSRVVKLL